MKMIVEMSNDEWIDRFSEIKPAHGDLCLIMYCTGDQTIGIGVYIDRMNSFDKNRGYFIGASDAWFENSVGCTDIQESFIYWGIVDKWKPLGLSEEDKERIMQTTKEIYGYEDEDPAPWEDET